MAIDTHTERTNAGTDLTGRTVLVTGASRGIGAETARRLAGAGARLALSGRDTEALATVADELPGDPVILPAELSDARAVSALLNDAVERLGGLDVLVNNAGAFHLAPSHTVTAADIDALFALNVRAPLLLAGGAAATMAESGGGSIISIGSAVGVVGTPPTFLYSATKGALHAASRALAAEWGPLGVRVNTVEPGIVRSDMTTQLWSNPDLSAFFHQQVPLRRFAEPLDVAQAVLYLASDASGYVTGQEIVVDGGWTGTAITFPAQ